MKALVSHSREETIECGKSFGTDLQGGDVVALTGELGSGKTSFIAGVCEQLAVTGYVASPTFTIINEYPTAGGCVVHIDLYRISSEQELAELGIEEYLNDRTICLIEWAERMGVHLPAGSIRVTLSHGGREEERMITIDVPARAKAGAAELCP